MAQKRVAVAPSARESVPGIRCLVGTKENGLAISEGGDFRRKMFEGGGGGCGDEV